MTGLSGDNINEGLQFLTRCDIIENERKKEMDYLTGLKTAAYILSVTLFVMSWDYIPPLARKVFNR